MSQTHDVVQEKTAELRRLRDELRLKVELGRMEAREVWDDLERRWNQLEARAMRRTRESGATLEETADSLRRAIEDLREGYDRLAAMLRDSDPDDLWRRLRNTLDRLVEGGHRAAERVVDSFEDLGDVARLRMEKVRLERTLMKKCAELGSRVYALAKQPGPDERRPQTLADGEVKALLLEIGSLDADLQKTLTELTEPDRTDA
jgi:hypothetical protein